MVSFFFGDIVEWGKVYEQMELLWSQTNLLEEKQMGKTGTTKWGRIKHRKGQIIMVPESELTYKRSGPNQRYTSSGAKRKKIARSPKAIVKG
jgi:hypothetical protein